MSGQGIEQSSEMADQNRGAGSARDVGSGGGAAIVTNSESSGIGDILALSFATAVAIWAVAYVCRVPMIGPVAGSVTVALMLLAVFLGGVAAGRFTSRGLKAGIAVGLITGALDILVVLSTLHDTLKDHPQYREAQTLAMWIAGSILLNVMVAGAGSLLGVVCRTVGRTDRAGLATPFSWPALFAWTLATATLFLIGAGGLVTAWGSGMAVPDWPSSFGYNMFLFPLSRMQADNGTFYEHAHRLLGTLVGLTSLTLALYLSITEKRRPIVLTAWVIFAAVCMQGILGGIRVTHNSRPLAIVHGVFAQILFSTIVCLAIATSQAWRRFPAKPSQPPAYAKTDYMLTTLLVAATVLQLVLGAILRHLDWQVLFHITNAVFVTLLALFAGIRAWGLNPHAKPLQRAGIALMLILLCQLIVGVVALAVRTPKAINPTGIHAFVTTVHQVVGAVLLAATLALALWTRRCHR